MSTMYSASGILEYFNLLDPINLIEGPIYRDIRSWIEDVQKNLDGKRATWDIEVSAHIILCEPDPEDSGEDEEALTLNINKIPGGATILNKRNGFTNFSAYLGTLLESMNGQLVHFNCTPTSFTIVSDVDQDVYGLWRDRDYRGNDILIEDGKERTVCKVGQGQECCIFPVISKDGFECTKFSSSGRYMLDRLKKGDTNAKRIGNCRVLGYKKQDETVS